MLIIQFGHLSTFQSAVNKVLRNITFASQTWTVTLKEGCL